MKYYHLVRREESKTDFYFYVQDMGSYKTPQYKKAMQNDLPDQIS